MNGLVIADTIKHNLCSLTMKEKHKHQQIDRILFTNSAVSVGSFDCPASRTNFRNTGPIKNYLIAFPRTAVKIRHCHMKNAFIADSTLVTLYNDGQEYERYQLSDYGDRCDWLTVSPTIARAILDNLNSSEQPCIAAQQTPLKLPKTGESSINLFPMTHSTCSPDTYALFKYLIMKLQCQNYIDNLFVEETVLHIFNNIIRTAYSDWGMQISPKRKVTYRRHLKLTQQAQEILNTCYDQPLSLANLANELNCSVFHLCRTYNRITGMSIHQTINQLRLREALHGIAETKQDLAALGIQLGFSDHSHFSLSFRKNYGLTPSQFRQHILSH